jgi:hypothetical protein
MRCHDGGCMLDRTMGVEMDMSRHSLVSGATAEQVQATPGSFADEALHDPEQIRALLTAAAATGGRALLRREGRAVQVALERCDADAGRLVWQMIDRRSEWGQPPHEVDVLGPSSVLRLRLSDDVEAQGPSLVSPLPAELRRVRRRAQRRAPAPTGLRVDIELPDGAIRYEVVDVAAGGVALVAGGPAAERWLAAGQALPAIALPIDARPIRCQAVVRHVTPGGDGRVTYGVSLALEGEDSTRWEQLVLQALNPCTRPCEGQLERMWELFDLSGYFNLAGRTGDSFAAVRESFFRTTARTAAIPELFCHTVWPSGRGIEATVSAMKSYRYTWQTHQLAKRPGPGVAQLPGQVVRDVLVRAYEHAQADRGCRWVLAYVEKTTPFMDLSHLRFARRMASTGLALSMPVRMMDAHCSERSGLADALYDVGPATGDEARMLVAALARTRPRCYVEAMDLTGEGLDLRGAGEAWARRGLRRERAVFVARCRRQPLAALVVEHGEPGTNLFSLLDAARVVPLAPLPQEETFVYAALLDHARRWYADRGVASFTYIREDDDDSYAEACRLHDAPEAEPHLWILSSRLLPEFTEYLGEVTVGRRPAPRLL